MTAEALRWQDLALRAGTVFTPNTPIEARSLFAGRIAQVRRIVDVVNQTGQHAILFGERGVGKTSLANVLSQFLPTAADEKDEEILAPRINCDGGDNFDTVWRKIFNQIELTQTKPVPGFHQRDEASLFNPTSLVSEHELTPDAVRRILTIMGKGTIPILIVDEFDRLQQPARRAFADLIKSLSDHAVPATVVLVGVANSVGDLIEEHQSVARSLVQIQMPRMDEDEIRQIIVQGVAVLEMTIQPEALDRIARLSQGLPHYAHLLGLDSSRTALDAHSTEITVPTVNEATKKAIEDAQQSIREAYLFAVRSARKDNLFGSVLLACALAEADQLGFFAAQDVRPQLFAVTGTKYEIPTFAQHLNEFSDDGRGRILEKHGIKRRYRYRFRDPLMQPYVIMQGMVAGRLTDEMLGRAAAQEPLVVPPR